MATINIGNQFSTYIADQGDTTYLLKAGDSATGFRGIDASTEAANRTFVINGELWGGDSGLRLIAADGSHDQIVIGATGSVGGEGYGLVANSDNLSIANHGFIGGRGNSGDGTGLRFVGEGASIENDGVIAGRTGISGLGSSGGQIVNRGTVVGATTGISLHADDVSDDRMKIVNEGSVSGHSYSVRTGDYSADTLINKGGLNGNVDLGGNADVFRNVGGHVNGVVDGGAGDDRYYIDNAKIEITELDNNGWDKLFSSASWTNETGIEEAYLTGKKNISLAGGSFGEYLFGNAGNNRIKGNEGGDKIDGGRGNDILTGSDGLAADASDIFIFRKGSGKDVVTDFQDGTDVMNLAAYKGLDAFSDLKGHIKQVGDDVVVSLLDGDQITLRDTQRADIGAGDFFFG